MALSQTHPAPYRAPRLGSGDDPHVDERRRTHPGRVRGPSGLGGRRCREHPRGRGDAGNARLPVGALGSSEPIEDPCLARACCSAATCSTATDCSTFAGVSSVSVIAMSRSASGLHLSHVIPSDSRLETTCPTPIPNPAPYRQPTPARRHPARPDQLDFATTSTLQYKTQTCSYRLRQYEQPRQPRQPRRVRRAAAGRSRPAAPSGRSLQC